MPKQYRKHVNKATGTVNEVGLNKGQSIFKGDNVFIKNVQRSPEDVWTCGTSC
jgi:uncharacterized C2H2 Zn-finger protein